MPSQRCISRGQEEPGGLEGSKPDSVVNRKLLSSNFCILHRRGGQLAVRLSQPPWLALGEKVSLSRCVQADKPKMGVRGCEDPSLQIQALSPDFVTRIRDPVALALDALIISWSQFRLICLCSAATSSALPAWQNRARGKWCIYLHTNGPEEPGTQACS